MQKAFMQLQQAPFVSPLIRWIEFRSPFSLTLKLKQTPGEQWL
jgi:hypothetical protein